MGNRGVSFYLALMVMTVLLGIVLGLSSILIQQIKLTRGMEDSVKALYVADTGIEMALVYRGDLNSAPCQYPGPYSDTCSVGGGEYYLKIEEEGDQTHVTSVGSYKGTSRALKTSWKSWFCGDTIDYGGQTYGTVQIGDQCWMSENLNVTDGNEDQPCSFTRYCYNDNSSNCDTYGGLYNWDDMMCGESSSDSNPSGVQGICPNGWHIPSDSEWCELEQQVCEDIGNTGCSTTFNCTNTGYRGEDTNDAHGEGSAMAGNTGSCGTWDSGSLNNSDSCNNDFGTSGLDVLPGGLWTSGVGYIGLGSHTYLWSSAQYAASSAWVRGLYYGHTDVYRAYSGEAYRFSVRCLRD